MKQKSEKIQKAKTPPASKTPPMPELKLTKKNYGLMAAGLVTIIAGFITLAAGSTTVAPILLVLGYCVLMPLALLLK